MIKKRPIDTLLILFALAFLGIFAYRKFFPYKIQKARPNIIVKANDLIKYKTVIPDKALNTTATSSACTVFLKNSAELSMNDYANEYVDHIVDKILDTCKGAFPEDLQKRIDEAMKACTTSTREKVAPECFVALMNAKSKSVAVAVIPDADPIGLDPAILVHLISDQFLSGKMMENPERALDLINALLEKEPNYLGGHKFKLFLLSISNLNERDDAQETFNEALEDARYLKTNDPEIEEMALAQKGEIFKQQRSTEKTMEYIEYLDEQAKQHPGNWMYDYYKANAVYQYGNGDYQKTLALVESALKKNPNDPRLKQTLANLKSDDENTRKHPFIMQIGWSLNDL